MTLVLNELSQGFIAHQLKSLAELFSSVVFVIRVNLFPSLDIFVPLWFMFTSLFFFILVNYYFKVSFNFDVILYIAK